VDDDKEEEEEEAAMPSSSYFCGENNSSYNGISFQNDIFPCLHRKRANEQASEMTR
jgi:hypothetical protein